VSGHARQPGKHPTTARSFARHRAHTPSGSAMRRSSRSFNDQRDLFRRKSRFATSSGCARQSRYPVAIKALWPLTNRSQTASKNFRHLRSALPSSRARIILARKRSLTDTFVLRTKRPSSNTSSSVACSCRIGRAIFRPQQK
jgi:hypothetical protein